MMRGQEAWSLASGAPGRDLPGAARPAALASRVRLFKLPFFRGIGVLGDSLAIGVKALAISGNQALEEEEQLTDEQMGWSLGIGAAFFTTLFILAPAAGTNWLSSQLPNSLVFNLVEGPPASPSSSSTSWPSRCSGTSARCSSTAAPST